MTTQTRTNARDEHFGGTGGGTGTALDGQTGTGAIAIFYGAARYPFEPSPATGAGGGLCRSDRSQPGHRVPRPTDAPVRAEHAARCLPARWGGVRHHGRPGPPPTSPPPKQTWSSTSSPRPAPTWSASTHGVPATAPHQSGGTTRRARGCASSMHLERKSAGSASRPANRPTPARR